MVRERGFSMLLLMIVLGSLATVAMLFVGLLQSAIGALIVPIFDQALRQSGESGQRTPTLFGLQHFIPDSGFEAWRTIAVLLVAFTVAKGVAEYFSTYLMARVGHRNMRTTQTYLHLTGPVFREDAAALERRLLGVEKHVVQSQEASIGQ